MIVCVTGGRGGVGSTICRLLGEGTHTERPIAEVRVLDIAAPPRGGNFAAWDESPDGDASKNVPRLRFVQGSVCERADLLRAFEDCDAVIHVASFIDFLGNQSRRVFQVNIEGTRQVIAACRKCKVPSLIYASSLDAITGYGPVNVKSDAAYPVLVEDFNSQHYGFSKSVAESLVLAANDGHILRTCALRFRFVYGEHDAVTLVTVLRARFSGLMSFKFGPGDAKQDNTYNGNVAFAHICALNAFTSDDESRITRIAGRGLNISHETPRSIYELAEPYLRAFKLELPAYSAPIWAVRGLAHMLEGALALLPSQIRPHNTLNPGVMDAVVEDKLYRDEDALQRLGFKPLYSEEEAFLRTLKWLKEEWPHRPNGPLQLEGRGKATKRMINIALTVLLAILTRWFVFVMYGL